MNVKNTILQRLWDLATTTFIHADTWCDTHVDWALHPDRCNDRCELAAIYRIERGYSRPSAYNDTPVEHDDDLNPLLKVVDPR